MANVNQQLEKASPGTREAEMLCKRYREIHFDYSSDFNKSNMMLKNKREERELFGKSHDRFGDDDSENKENEQLLLRERAGLDGSISTSKNIVDQAKSIFDDLRNQSSNLGRSGKRVAGIQDRVPGINKVIDNIRRKKQKGKPNNG